MGNGVTFQVIKELPLSIGRSSVAIGDRRYSLLRSYINRGVRHFTAEAFATGERVDFIVKGRKALICTH